MCSSAAAIIVHHDEAFALVSVADGAQNGPLRNQSEAGSDCVLQDSDSVQLEDVTFTL